MFAMRLSSFCSDLPIFVACRTGPGPLHFSRSGYSKIIKQLPHGIGRAIHGKGFEHERTELDRPVRSRKEDSGGWP